METDIPQMYKDGLQEIERLLSSKSVVGERIEVEGAVLVPLVSTGFAFGVGAGSGTDGKSSSTGTGGGTGGGGGVKPVAVVVVDKTGVHVERINGSRMDALGGAIAQAIERRNAEKK